MKPEQVKVSVKLANGSVVIMSVVTNDFNGYAHLPETDYINALITQSSGHGWPSTPVSWRFIQDAEIPPDRYFRAAWEDNGALAVNMPKARAVHMDTIRAARLPVFKKLDEAYLRADESGDLLAKQRIAQKKQALRDLPQTFDLSGAATPEQLKALWPAELT